MLDIIRYAPLPPHHSVSITPTETVLYAFDLPIADRPADAIGLPMRVAFMTFDACAQAKRVR